MARKLLYLSPYFWPEETGSAPYATDLARHLHETGHDLRVEAFRPHYPDPAPFAAWADGSRDAEVVDGIPVRRARARARGDGGFRARLANDLRYLFHVLRGLAAGRFRGTDVTVAYVPTILTLYAAFAVRIVTGARIVAVVHDIESGLAAALGIARGGLLLRLMRLAERVALNRADHVVVLTDGMRGAVRALGCRRPVSVVPIWAEAAPACPPPVPGRALLMYSGNFGRKQNLDQILPLLARLDRDGAPVDTLLRGEGSERARIAAEVARQGIGHVRFLPFAPADRLTAALQEAHVHLVPQAQNVANYALPSKLIAIMAAGRPFVCIADPGSPLDLLARDSGAGLCIAPGDDDGLFRAVTALAADPVRQAAMGRAGQAHVRAACDRGPILHRHRAIIESVVTGDPAPAPLAAAPLAAEVLPQP